AIIACLIMIMSPKKIKNNTYILYSIFCVLLIGLLILPETSITPIINGAKSWYSFGPISIQPSEFMKIILILALAKTISKHNQFTFNKSFQSDLMLFFKILGVSIIPMALILLQNDLGTTLVLCAIIAGVMLVSGITWRILAPLFIVAFVSGSSIILAIIYKPSLIENLLGIKMYQMGRINSWLDPYSYSSGDGYHLTESLKAIGSGQLLGKGYNHGEVYIPENHTDFIFSVIGEEMGFIGSVLLILLFLFLIFHLIRLASKIDSQFNKVFIIGYVSLIVFHVLQNIGMTVQLLPITGIPLPFISYGGSSLWSLMTGIGVVLSIYYHEPQRYEIPTLSKKSNTI
ncbi:rod shape-determining protein RodA, partial [Staphylococcus epidermidis]|uniref:FtsW/RodA/SpoVE family cell cycle protein n=1 Tax=Staphylococcus epidermidis TaxID=1282 RepID=UPI0010034197